MNIKNIPSKKPVPFRAFFLGFCGVCVLCGWFCAFCFFWGPRGRFGRALVVREAFGLFQGAVKRVLGVVVIVVSEDAAPDRRQGEGALVLLTVLREEAEGEAPRLEVGVTDHPEAVGVVRAYWMDRVADVLDAAVGPVGPEERLPWRRLGRGLAVPEQLIVLGTLPLRGVGADIHTGHPYLPERLLASVSLTLEVLGTVAELRTRGRDDPVGWCGGRGGIVWLGVVLDVVRRVKARPAAC